VLARMAVPPIVENTELPTATNELVPASTPLTVMPLNLLSVIEATTLPAVASFVSMRNENRSKGRQNPASKIFANGATVRKKQGGRAKCKMLDAPEVRFCALHKLPCIF
jgi:hypothetical protein